MVLEGQRERQNTVTNLCVQTFRFFFFLAPSSFLKSSVCFPQDDCICQSSPITQILANFATADCRPGRSSLMLAFSSAAAKGCAHWTMTLTICE